MSTSGEGADLDGESTVTSEPIEIPVSVAEKPKKKRQTRKTERKAKLVIAVKKKTVKSKAAAKKGQAGGRPYEPYVATERDLANAVQIMKMGGDVTRINLLSLIDGERSVGEMAIELGKTQPAISHHLNLLKLSNLVKSERDGKNIRYSLRPPGKAILAAVRTIVEVCNE